MNERSSLKMLCIFRLALFQTVYSSRTTTYRVKPYKRRLMHLISIMHPAFPSVRTFGVCVCSSCFLCIYMTRSLEKPKTRLRFLFKPEAKWDASLLLYHLHHAPNRLSTKAHLTVCAVASKLLLSKGFLMLLGFVRSNDESPLVFPSTD